MGGESGEYGTTGGVTLPRVEDDRFRMLQKTMGFSQLRAATLEHSKSYNADPSKKTQFFRLLAT